MKVREYIHQAGITKEQFAEILGHKSTSMVTRKMDFEMPIRWGALLDSLDDPPLTAVGGEESPEESDARSPKDSWEEPLNDWESRGRESDYDPSVPTDATRVVGPQKIKLTTVRGYIELFYSGAAQYAKQRGDDIAADTITRYTPEFSEAWINYIESDPRIMAYLEKLMVGTPLGNLIGVHAIAIGSYVFARVAAREIAQAIAAEGANANGSPNASTADFLG